MPIEDFIPSYPRIDNDFTFEFSRLKEVNDLVLNAGYTQGVEEGLFPNQTLIKRFFSGATDYPSAIIANEVGTGKSRAAAAVAELWKKQLNGIVPRSKALVLVKNDVLARNFINEVLTYTKNSGEYIARFTEDEMKDISEEVKHNRLVKEVRKVYEVETFGTFLAPRGENAVGMNTHRAREEYSDRVIIVDEVHNIRPQSEAGRFKDGDEPGEAKESNDEVYKKLHDFLHAVERCRILLMTGTPAVDQASEIADLMNLILPLNAQLETGSSFFRKYFDGDKLSERGRKELSQAFKGRIFYLRAVNSGVKKTTVGQTSPYTLHIKVYPSRMSRLQTKAVKSSQKRTTAEVGRAQAAGGGVAKVMPLSASLCVIPKKHGDGGYTYEYGNEGCLDVCGKNVKDPNKVTYSLPPYVVDLYKKNLAEYSAKYATFIRLIEEHPNEVVFAFSKYSKGSGAVLLGMILEQVCGWQRIRSSKEMKYPDEKRKRFAIISGEKFSTHSDPEIQALLAAHNKPENWDGKYLRVIIGTTKISEGVTIKHVRQFHNLVPLWNFPSLVQATARAIRFGSHEHIPEEERHITLYNHVAIFDTTPDTGDFIEEDIPTDIEVYRIAEEKSFKVALVYRVLKENAVDCVTNYKRNVLEVDEEMSRDTDYQQRNYVCAGFPDEYIDKTTIVWDYNIPREQIDPRNYNYLYSTQEQEKFENEIKELFRSNYSLSLSNIISHLKVVKEDVPALVKALAKLVEYRYILRDRLGFMNYLYEHDNVYKLSSIVESGNVFEERQSLEDMVETSEMANDLRSIQKFCFENYDKYSYNTRVIIMETLFVYELQGKKMHPKLKELLETKRSKFYKVKGGWVYNFKSEIPASTSYAAGVEKVTEVNIHFLADGTQTWVTVDDPEILSEADIRRREETSVSDIGGYIEGGLFKLKSKSKTGRICKTFNADELYRLFEKLDFIPDPDSLKISYRGTSRGDLLNIYNGIQTKYEKFMSRSIDKLSTEQLRGVVATMNLKKEELCRILEEEYQKRGLLVVK